MTFQDLYLIPWPSGLGKFKFQIPRLSKTCTHPVRQSSAHGLHEYSRTLTKQRPIRVLDTVDLTWHNGSFSSYGKYFKKKLECLATRHRRSQYCALPLATRLTAISCRGHFLAASCCSRRPVFVISHKSHQVIEHLSTHPQQQYIIHTYNFK